MKSFKINVSKIEKSFARMYWTAKMHKNPPGARFIAASARCISKPVSKILAKCLKVIQLAHVKLCQRKQNETGFRHMWIIGNSHTLLLEMDELNRRAKGRNIGIYDFKTLHS